MTSSKTAPIRNVWLLSALGSCVAFFVIDFVVRLVAWELPGSPTGVAPLLRSDVPDPERLTTFLVYNTLLVRTLPYLFTGVMAAFLSGKRGTLLCALFLIAWSHFFEPMTGARLLMDYIRLSAYSMGVLIGFALLTVAKRQSST